LGRCHDGELVCLVAFGGGLTWCGVLLRWQPTAVGIDDPGDLDTNLGIAGREQLPSQDHKEVSA
jgi:hypothetical protein